MSGNGISTSFTNKGRPKVNTPKVEKDQTDRLSSLLEEKELLS